MTAAPLHLVYAREALPAVFLAGPTPRAGSEVPSWRPAAVEALAEQWTDLEPLTVLTPEPRSGRAVLGCPPDCPNPERNRYLAWVARRHGAPVCETLTDTAAAALTLITNTAAAASR